MQTTSSGSASAAPPAASFAALLRRLRTGAGLTQEELAERAGLTAHAVSALERGTRTRPYPHTVRQLAAALDADDATRAALLASLPGRAATPEQAPPPAAPGTHALVVPATPLFGREQEVTAVSSLLRGQVRRLVTLTGTGGVGKTRLADAVVRHVADGFPDGVVAVALAPVSSGDDVLPAVARALGAPLPAGCDPLGVVVDAVAGRRLLLLLDNLEHVLGTAPQVAALVAASPALTVLVTSRAPLRVRGEAEHAVLPLDVPHADDVRAVEQSAAGALFLERARTIAPDFARAPGEAATVAELCRRLAGIPLALELAAARARVLDADSLLARLDAAVDRSAPRGAARDLPERQQTMRAALDWSYELLGDGERRLFRRLGVFAGGFDLEAAEAVADGDGCLAELEALVEHSLVTVRPGGRYGLLEPIAQYARWLLPGDELADASRAHALHHLAVAERCHDAYAGADQLEALAVVERHDDDMVLALERSLAAGDGRTAAHLCWELQRFWWFRSRVPTGRRLCERVVASQLEPADLAVASLAAGCMALALDDPPAAGAHWTRALELAGHVTGIDVAAHAASGLALVAMAQGDLGTAAAHLDVASERAAHGTRSCCAWLGSMCAIWRGTLLRATGDVDGARASVERGLEGARRRGDRLASYMALYNLGYGALLTGDREEARRHLEAGLRLAHETGDLLNVAHFAQALELVAVAEDEHDRAALLRGGADALLETFGTGGDSYRLLSREALTAARNRAREALGADDYDDAVDRGRTLTPQGLHDLVLPPAGRLRIVEPRRATS